MLYSDKVDVITKCFLKRSLPHFRLIFIKNGKQHTVFLTNKTVAFLNLQLAEDLGKNEV